MLFQKGNKVNLGRKHSIEAKRNMSQAHKGRKHSDATKEKMSQSKIGNKHFLGRKHSQETKKRMSKTKRGSKNPAWKGGQYKQNGRVIILMPTHPHAQNNGYISQSHLVMEKMLGRYLEPCEVVHHINSIIDDDRPENLQLFSNQSAHMKFHRKIKYWSSR